MRLSRRSEPFDSDDYIFELKIDAFRSPMSKAAYVISSHAQGERAGNSSVVLRASILI
jgi:hypothetical protein